MWFSSFSVRLPGAKPACPSCLRALACPQFVDLAVLFLRQAGADWRKCKIIIARTSLLQMGIRQAMTTRDSANEAV